MCEAARYKEELDKDFEYDTGYYVDCYGDEAYGTHGFIFRDGSLLDIGIGEDHRIIDIDDWCGYGMLTYTCVNREMDLRINCMLEWSQLETAMNLAKNQDVNVVYVDVYNHEDLLIGSFELRDFDISAEEIWDRITSLKRW